METKEFSNKRAYLFSLIIVTLIILNAYVGKIASIAAFSLFLVSTVFLQKIDLYVILFAIFPFANLFKTSPSAMSLMTVCEIILFALIFLEYVQGKLKVKTSFLLSLLAFGIYLLVGFFSTMSFPIVVKMLIRPVLLYYMFNSDFSIEKKRAVTIGIVYTLSVSMILMMTVSLNTSFMERIVDYLRVVQMRSGLQELTRNGGLLDDPNYCSLAILMTLSLLSVLYYSKKIGNAFWLLSIPLIVMGITTYSKSYFICIVVYVVLLIMFILFPKHLGWGVIISIVVVMLAFAIMSGRIEAINVILERFNARDVTSGRTVLNAIYWEYLRENPIKMLFGNGIAVHTISGYNNVHNLFLECLYKLGIAGSAIYSFVIGSCLYEKGKKRKIIVYIPALFMVVMYFALAGLVAFELIYYLMICGIAAKYTQSGVTGEDIDEKI